MPKLIETEYEEHGMSESLAERLNAEAKLREEANALRPKQPKKEKKLTTEEVVDRMITDAVMLKEPFSRFMNMQRTFLKQIQKEIEEKKQHVKIQTYGQGIEIKDKEVVDIDWINIIFRRYTE